MINQCPQCSSKITDFAVNCENCDWSLVPEHEPADFRISIDADGALGRFESEEAIEEPILIVKKNRRRKTDTNALLDQPIQPASAVDDFHSVPLDEADSEADSQINEATQRALEFIELGDYEASLTHLNRAVIDLPTENSGECYSLRGYTHLKNLDFPRGRKRLHTCH